MEIRDKYDRPIRVGDRVQVDTGYGVIEGRVIEIWPEQSMPVHVLVDNEGPWLICHIWLGENNPKWYLRLDGD